MGLDIKRREDGTPISYDGSEWLEEARKSEESIIGENAAAESYATEDIGYDADGEPTTQVIFEEFWAFKAGIEWAVKQGLSFNGLIDYNTGELINFGYADTKDKLKNFSHEIQASAVTIQVRKR